MAARRVNFFDPEPNPPYPDGDHSADVVGRHAVWDVDSDMPDDLAQFLADALESRVWPDTTPLPRAVQRRIRWCR